MITESADAGQTGDTITGTMADAFRSLHLQQYHHLFLSKQTRADGRNFTQFRDIDVTINPVETADGSCSVRYGNSSVICGSKLTIEKPDTSQPVNGMLDVTIKLPPNSLYKYKWNKDAYADEEQVMASQISKALISSECVDWDQLVIEPEKDVWQLSLEVICLDFDGNIRDVAMAAVIGCLMCTTIPDVLPRAQPSDLFTFTDRRQPLRLKNYPISCSFAVVSPEVTIADPTVDEEILSSGVVNIIVRHPDNAIVRLQKESGFPVSEELLSKLLDLSEERTAAVYNVIQKSIPTSR